MTATDTAPERLPVSVLTGFLGSGKTTLLARLVRQPAMGRTAVVINEFGEIGLDHELVEGVEEDTVVMDSGCLCCTIRGDLVTTLRRLIARRAAGDVAAFDRVVIETTGLADPAPILHTLMADPVVTAQFCLDGVVTTVDAVHGAAQLDAQPESVKQAAVADRILVTKPDLAPETGALEARLKDLNPAAPIYRVAFGEIEADRLFNAGLYDPTTKSTDVERWLKEEAYAGAQSHGHHHRHDVNRHDDRIGAYCIRYDRPIEWPRFVDWIEALTAVHGDRLLRLKGILDVEGAVGPVAVHGIHHVFHPPAMLERWPSDARHSRLVMITRDLPREPVEEMLRAFLEAGPAPGGEPGNP